MCTSNDSQSILRIQKNLIITWVTFLLICVIHALQNLKLYPARVNSDTVTCFAAVL